MNRTRPTIQTYAIIALATLCLILSVLIASELPVRADSGPAATPALSGQDRQEIVWRGAAGDGLWSNPANWENGRLPTSTDVVRFRGDTPDAHLDAAFGGVIAGLLLDADYTGTLRLERSLVIAGDLEMAGGTLLGGPADLEIMGAVRVRGGSLVTPSGATMNTVTMDIAAPGVVQMSAYGKLNLSGAGQPLTGDGLLDMTTHAPNSIEYTGAATADLTAAGPAAALQEIPQDGFSAIDTLGLSPLENPLSSAVVDPAGEYAYFGANTYPGIVIKIDLATFTRVGSLTLNKAGQFMSAVMDPAGEYAYFGTSEYVPSVVVKIDLSTFTRADELTLQWEDGWLISAVIDPAGEYAYFGTGNEPGSVIKIDLTTFTRAGALTLNAGENKLQTAMMDPAGDFAYFGTYTAYTDPNWLVKIDLATFTRADALMLDQNDSIVAGAIDPAGGYAYLGAFGSKRILKIDLASFSYVDALVVDIYGFSIRSILADPVGDYIYVSFYYPTSLSRPGNSGVYKVATSTFTHVNTLLLPEYDNATGLRHDGVAVISPSGEHAYFGMVVPHGAPGASPYPARVARADLTTFTSAGLIKLNGPENNPISAVIDPAGEYAYIGTDTAPGIVVKVNLTTFARVGSVVLEEGENYLRAALMDPAGEYAYFGAYTNPGRIVKIDLATFTRVDALTLNAGESWLRSAVMDPTGAHAYFGANTAPGQVVKINLATFTRTSALTLSQGQNDLTVAAIDPAGAFAYFGTHTSPGIVVKVNLATFTPAGALTLAQDEDNLLSAVIDPDGRYAYFGAGTDASPGIVVRVDLATFTRAAALTLNATEYYLHAAVIDPAGQYAYFGAGSGRVIRVDLAAFAHAGAVTVNAYLSAAIMDPASNYAYFIAYSSHNNERGQLIKVDLNTLHRVARLQVDAARLDAALIEPNGRYAYFVGATRKVVKIDLFTFTQVGILTWDIPRGSQTSAAVMDPAGMYVYVATTAYASGNSNPHLIKVSLADFTIADMLMLDTSVVPRTAVIDPSGNYAYLGTSASPAGVHKIHLPTMTHVDSLTLLWGENDLRSAVMDPAGEYAYFGTHTAPGRVVKIDLTNFERVGVLPFPTNDHQLTSAVISPTGDYAYFGAYSGRVLRINLSDFTYAGRLNATSPTSAAIAPDGRSAYFGSNTAPGIVAHINLETWSFAGETRLLTFESKLTSAVIDPLGGYAYFGSEIGYVIKVEVGAHREHIPVSGGNVALWGITYNFPANAFSNNVFITHSWLSPGDIPLPNNLSSSGYLYHVSATYSATGTSATLSPGATYSIALDYSHYGLGNVDEQTAALYRYDGVNWTDEGISSFVNTETKQVTAVVNSLGIFGVFGEGERKVYLPMVLSAQHPIN